MKEQEKDLTENKTSHNVKDKKKKGVDNSKLKEIENLKKENSVLNDKVLRISAEMQNMKKRYEEEIAKIYKYEGEAFIKKILNILDNFERAIEMDDDNLEDEVSKFLDGFKLIYNDLEKNLKEIGVEEIVCLDTEFDPVSMEAVMTEHVDNKSAGIVTAVMQKGYKYNDKVIRPAMVKVNE